MNYNSYKKYRELEFQEFNKEKKVSEIIVKIIIGTFIGFCFLIGLIIFYFIYKLIIFNF
jgi:hypothetical protein